MKIIQTPLLSPSIEGGSHSQHCPGKRGGGHPDIERGRGRSSEARGHKGRHGAWGARIGNDVTEKHRPEQRQKAAAMMQKLQEFKAAQSKQTEQSEQPRRSEHSHKFGHSYRPEPTNQEENTQKTEASNEEFVNYKMRLCCQAKRGDRTSHIVDRLHEEAGGLVDKEEVEEAVSKKLKLRRVVGGNFDFDFTARIPKDIYHKVFDSGR